MLCITIIFVYLRIKTGSYGIYTIKTQYFFIVQATVGFFVRGTRKANIPAAMHSISKAPLDKPKPI